MMWLTTKKAQKKLKKEVKRRRKQAKLQVRRVKKSIKARKGDVKRLRKDGVSVLARKKMFDKKENFAMHRFASKDEAETAVKALEDSIQDALNRVTAAERAKKRARKIAKEPKVMWRIQAQSDLIEKESRKAAAELLESQRVSARVADLRRPWDGPDGRDYLAWRQAQDAWEKALAATEDQSGSDDDTSSSEDEAPRDATLKPREAAAKAGFPRKAFVADIETEEQRKMALKELNYDWSDVSEDESNPDGEFADGIWSDTDSGSGSDTGYSSPDEKKKKKGGDDDDDASCGGTAGF